MKKFWIALWVLTVLLITTLIWRYNNFVVLDESVKLAWSQVENQYQRRADLVPQLVAVVWKYAEHEKETLESVVKARSEALSIKVDINNLEDFKAFYQSQWELTQALSKLMLLQENYPDLKAAPLFSNLQTQLEWTENRISTERGRYNEEVMKYNSLVRQFPNNIISGIFDLWAKPVFEAWEWSDIAPNVKQLFE